MADAVSLHRGLCKSLENSAVIAEPTLEVLCEDGPILAVNKPAGLLTQGVPHGHVTLEALVRGYIKHKYSKPGNVYLGIPHRLDRPTSGVIVFARNSKAAARLAEQFHDRKVRKVYLAVVDGVPSEPEAALTDWLLKDAERSHVECVDPVTPGAKRASLSYRVLQERDGRTLLQVEPKTGRMHQIRVQLARCGLPIVGDVQYGYCRLDRTGSLEGNELPAPFGESAIALHASRITILHPIRYNPLTISAGLPDSWKALGWDAAAMGPLVRTPCDVPDDPSRES